MSGFVVTLLSALIDLACLFISVHVLYGSVMSGNLVSANFVVSLVLIPFFLYLVYKDILFYMYDDRRF